MRPKLSTPMIILSLFLLVLGLAGQAQAATTYYWRGAADGEDWNDGNNWATTEGACGATGGTSWPDQSTSDSAIFTDSCTTDCTLDGSADMINLTIEAGYTGTLGDDGSIRRLLIYGTVTPVSLPTGTSIATQFHYMPSDSTQTTIVAADYAGNYAWPDIVVTGASLEMMPNSGNANLILGGDVTAYSLLMWDGASGTTVTLDTNGYNITTTKGFNVGTRAGLLRDHTLKNTSATVSTIDVGGNLQIDGSASPTGTRQIQSDNINLLVAGNWSNYDTYTFTAGNSCTVTFDGTADQTIITDGDAFNNLTLNNTGSSGSDDIIISNTLDVDGTLTITDGDLDIGTNNPAVNTAGNLSIGASGSVTKGTGTWSFDGTTTATLTDSTASTQNLGNLQIGDGTNAKTVNLGSNVKSDNLTISANGTLDASGSNYGLTCAGSWSNSGTFNEQQGTVTFTGTSKTIGAETFYGLTVDSGASVSTSGNVNATNFTNSGTFTVSTGNTFTPSGTYTNSGTVTESGTGKIVLPATSCKLTDSSGTEKATYNMTTDSIYVRIVDEDENLDGTAKDTLAGTVTVTGGTNGDSETVANLTETDVASEIFLSSALATAVYDGAKSNNDGTLELSDGETITVTYTDDEDSSDNAATDTATGNTSANFLVSVSSPQVAGTNFTMTITARNADGTTDTSYSGTANITSTYVSPTSGTKTLAATSTSTFTSGVATVTQRYDDAGTITITATDASNSSIYGTSNNIVFVPDSFTLSTSKTTFSVNEPFTLTITAKNSAGTTTANYKGASTLSINYVTPSTSQSGTLSTATLTGSSWSSGVYTLSNFTYNKFGIITITCKDPTDTTQTGTSSQLTFLPLKLELSLASPGGGRDFYYSGEDIATTVKALDYNGNTIANYASTVGFSGDYLDLPSNYAFTSSDSGTHIFSDVSATDKGTTSITATDTTYSAATGTSSEFKVKEGTIRVLDTSGPVGTLPVTVKLIDSDGNDITNDSGTEFTLTLSESRDDGTASSAAETSEVTFDAGEAEIEVTDTEAEVVTVTPVSEDYLDVIAGKVTFGGAGAPRFGSGSHILWWRELRSDEAR